MPTRKDKTNVAPIYREQVFIPASGTTLMKQKARPKVAGRPVSSGAVEIVSPEFDLLTGIRGIANLPKGFLKTNKLPQGENLYYRQLDKSSKGLERAKQVGVIDTKSSGGANFTTSRGTTLRIGKTFDTPFFAKGSLWYNNVDDMDVIVGKDNPLLDWKMITQHGRVTENAMKAANRRTPFYNGATNQAPTELFELYRRYPGIGYRNVTYGFPTIPITGLNTVAEQMKCGGRRKAQLGLDIREGGIAIPIAPNMYYMDGRSHDDGGIAIGPNNKNGLEVEGGEVVKVGKNDVKVFSNVPLLRGVSPAQLVMGGANPNKVFKAQEEFKDRNRINDDGTHYEVGGEKIYTPSKSIQRQIQETGRITIGGAPTIGGLRTYRYVKGLANVRKYANKGNLILDKVNTFVNKSLQGLINKRKITTNQADAYKKFYNEIVGVNGVNIPKTASFFLNNESKEMKAGGIYIKPSKRGTFTAAAAKHGMGAQEFASKVLANKEDYSPAMVKKANFARNASRWKKEYGGDDTKTAALKRLRNKFTIAGDYDGGMFGGAGAGSVIMPQPEFITDTITKRYLVPVTQNFNDAFGNAVDAGLDKFMFDNKWYNTKKSNNINNNAAGAARTQTVYLPVEHKEVRRRKKEFGGSMIYTINGNVRNGLSVRPKAKYGTIDKKDKDTKVGQDGLIYKRAADGEWHTDGTVHVAFKKATPNGLTKPNLSSAKKFNYIAPEPKRVYIDHSDYEEEKETKKIGSLTYEKNKDDKWVPSAKQSTTITRDGGRPKDFGMTRTGVNHPNGSYKYHPLTGEKISEIGVVETSEPSVKGATKASSKSSSTARRRGTKASTPKTAAKTITKGADVKYGTPLKEKKESLYMTGIKNNSITPLRAGMEKIKSPSSTGGGTQSKDGRWIGQYKTTNVGDWIGLGSNLVGSVASYFMTKNAINKMPDPIKPVMAQAAKLKTRYNIEPSLTEIREAEQMNRAAVRRNTQSSNTSLAREQRLMNEARGARNTLYGQKENIETQLINQDRLNRQSVMRDNVRTYNEYLNRLTATKMAQNEMRTSNINNLISGLTGSVNNILGTIESRRATNNTLRAIAAANPNVDARLIGGFDYYIDPITKKKYNKNQQYVGTING